MLRKAYKGAATLAVGTVQILDSCVRVAYGITFKRTALFAPSRKAVVLGNGPSLKDCLGALEAIAARGETDFWCVNFFGSSPEYQKLKPNNYVIADPGHWQADVTEDLKHEREQFLQDVITATRWKVLFHFPMSAKGTDFVRRLTVNPCITVRFFNHIAVPCRYKSILHWLYRHEMAMPAPQNVLIPTIFLTILCKYQKVLVVGADHSWHNDIVVRDGTVMIRDRHFYDTDVALKPFFKNSSETFSMSEIFYIWGLVFSQYELLAAYARANGVDVLNGSSISFIDSFKQITVEAF